MKVPHLADLKPSGKYVMYDLFREGGVPAVLKALLDAGMLHGDCIDRDREDARREPEGHDERLCQSAAQKVMIRPLDAPKYDKRAHRHSEAGTSGSRGLAWRKLSGLKVRTHHRPGEGVRRRGGLLPGDSARGRSWPATWW